MTCGRGIVNGEIGKLTRLRTRTHDAAIQREGQRIAAKGVAWNGLDEVGTCSASKERGLKDIALLNEIPAGAAADAAWRNVVPVSHDAIDARENVAVDAAIARREIRQSGCENRGCVDGERGIGSVQHRQETDQKRVSLFLGRSRSRVRQSRR
jgi:hypothetical protein